MVGILTKGDIIKCLLKKLEIDYHEEEIHKYRASHIFEDINSDNTTLILRHKIIGGNHKHAGEQSGYLKINLLRLGIPPQIVRRIVIASCEAEMNIIIYTEGGELTVCVEEESITVNAIDSGPGIPDIEKIKNCSDEMRIDSKPGEGTNVEFVFFLKK